MLFVCKIIGNKTDYSWTSLSKWSPSENVQIFDLLGIEVKSVVTGLDLSTQRIDISYLPAGVYFIKIGDRFEKFVKK
ncbi:MAG: T9SS type A sorting domain-containing protein [Candidatus Kapabacteria bacterium]|nr:T9SS type A sorting domain-containing protein [Candidatus Kapabacteria bacterium]